MCYTIIVKRESDERLREVLLKNQRNLKKPLDNRLAICYNNIRWSGEVPKKSNNLMKILDKVIRH